MNLLTKEITKADDGSLSISNFRAMQYENLDYFIELAVNYLSKQNNNYLKIEKIQIIKLPQYVDIGYSDLTQITVYISTKSSPEKKQFFKILIPTLVDDMFFILNGNYYVPTLYIIDKPIVIKLKSIKLTSLFNSITIYDKLITFIGINIPARYLIDLLLDETDSETVYLKQSLISLFTIPQHTLTESELLKYFHNIFGCDEKREDIINHINNLFFDNYTKMLYQYCYDLKEEEITIVNILKLAIKEKISTDKTNYINLKFKRLIFLEALLAPFLKRIGYYATQTARGFQIDTIKMDQLELVKYFHSDLHNKFIYDSVNAYSGMLQHKASMLNPGSDTTPSIVANLHQTHFQRICPISISNQNPGETIYIVPTTKVDWFGQFVGV